MRRVRMTRRERVDLLTRPPSAEHTVESRITALIVNPVDQLRELAELFDRGLLSAEEFERQRDKVFGA
ncbi:MAG: SHOCT domain-containing protein [Jiangellaceae bacterium]